MCKFQTLGFYVACVRTRIHSELKGNMPSLIFILSHPFVTAILIRIIQLFERKKNYLKNSKWTLYYVRVIYQEYENKENVIMRTETSQCGCIYRYTERKSNLGLGCFH
jgi:hypothetical protein